MHLIGRSFCSKRDSTRGTSFAALAAAPPSSFFPFWLDSEYNECCHLLFGFLRRGLIVIVPTPIGGCYLCVHSK